MDTNISVHWFKESQSVYLPWCWEIIVWHIFFCDYVKDNDDGYKL